MVTPAAGVRIHESSTESGITVGETTIDVAPATAYAAVANYLLWPHIFANISTAQITKHDGDDARVTFFKPDGNCDNLHFHNRPSTQTIWFEDTGGSAEVWAEITFAPGADPGTARVQTRLFADLHGFASLFVADSKVREMRQQRVSDVLHDLQAYFARR
jgi:hypothetical protein